MCGVLSAVFCLLFCMNAQFSDNIALEHLGKVDSYITLSLPGMDSQRAISEFEKLSNQYKAVFIREDIKEEENRQVTYRTIVAPDGYWKSANYPLSSGRLPQSDQEFLATWQTGDQNQTGLIRDLFDDSPAIFQSLKGNPDLVLSQGTYILCSAYDQRDQILSELANDLELSKDEILETGFAKNYSPGPTKIVLAGAGILLLLYMMICLFYPFSKAKEISILRLEGWSLTEIWKKLMGEILLVAFFEGILATIVPFGLFRNPDLQFGLRLGAMELGVWLLCLVLTSISLLVIRNFTIGSMLKNQVRGQLPYTISSLMKAAVILVLACATPVSVTLIQTAFWHIQAIHAYDSVSDQMTLTHFEYVNDEFQQMLNGNHSLNRKFDAFFRELEQTADAGYFQALKYDQNYFNTTKPEPEPEPEPEPVTLERPIFEIQVNENELEQFANFFDHPVAEYFQTDEITILVPDSMSENEKSLAQFAFTYPYTVNGQAVSTHIETYKTANQPVFLQNGNLINTGDLFANDPAFVCLQGPYLENAGGLTNSALTNPIRILDTEPNRKAIQQAILNHELADNHVEIERMTNTITQEFINSSRIYISMVTGCLLFLGFSDLLASYYLLRIVLTIRKKEIFVKKLNGYPLASRYKKEVLMSISIWSAGIVVLILLKANFWGYCLYAVLFLLDVMIWIWQVKHQEKKSLALLLKGEE